MRTYNNCKYKSIADSVVRVGEAFKLEPLTTFYTPTRNEHRDDKTTHCTMFRGLTMYTLRYVWTSVVFFTCSLMSIYCTDCLVPCMLYLHLFEASAGNKRSPSEEHRFIGFTANSLTLHISRLLPFGNLAVKFKGPNLCSDSDNWNDLSPIQLKREPLRSLAR